MVVGAEVAFGFDLSRRTIGLVMAFGVGALISSVTFELVEESLVEIEPWQVGIGLGAGALAFFLGDRWVAGLGGAGRKNAEGSTEEEGNSGLGIAFGTLLDGVPESAVLGLTLLQSGEIGISMLIAVLISNLPEGVAATSSLRNGGWPVLRIYALWGVIMLASALSALAGYALLDGASLSALSFILAFAAGAILTMLATSMIPEAYEHAGRVVGIVTVFGFSVAIAINWLEG